MEGDRRREGRKEGSKGEGESLSLKKKNLPVNAEQVSSDSAKNEK